MTNKLNNRDHERLSGYLHPAYAESLVEFGEPHYLSQSQSYILIRQTGYESNQDAMGCYPLFTARDWSALAKDLIQIDKELVSLVMVTDPFGNYDLTLLQESFPDVVSPFKTHFVIDLAQPRESYVTSHHRRYIRKSLEQVQIERCNNPLDYLDTWVELYKVLIERHDIRGIAAFSRACFERQFRVPGLVMFRAIYQQKTVGMLLWYVQNNIGYYHLGAYNEEGYTSHSSFALFWTAINHFIAQGLVWLDLGAGAGLTAKEDGLTRFKKGWSNATRATYLCGRIFDREKYNELVRLRAVPTSSYFPLYRYSEHTS